MENMDQEPVISRLDRLDNVLKQLEIIKGGYHSPKSSTASTTSSSASDGCSDEFSPRSLEKHCRPIELVRMETGLKGTVIQRLAHIEDRLLKLEEEIEMEKRREALSSASVTAGKTSNSSSPRKSLKQLVKSCVKGKNK